MCGIAGVINLDGTPVDTGLLQRMGHLLRHRGPDGEGYYQDAGLGLVHRRLALVDLSEAGHQPMTTADGAWVLSFNGEIYNFRELREELERLGHNFVSRTDTEVLLLGYREWGSDFIKRLNGMFAFAIYDRRRQKLLLARDRYGIKPLYYTRTSQVFSFASEIKPLLALPSYRKTLDPRALSDYFTFQNVPGNRTLFRDIFLMEAGCWMELALDREELVPLTHRYWDYDFQCAGRALKYEAGVGAVRAAMGAAVGRQILADAPVGAYLSGGMDSGSVVALASRSQGRITTFTGGFDTTSAAREELNFDERRRAEAFALAFNAEHYQSVLHPGDMEHVLPQLIYGLEDLRVGQCYPNYYVARLASRFVKAVLSGTGGDELFAGYPWRYQGAMEAEDEQSFRRAYYSFWQRLVPEENRSAFYNAATWKDMKELSPYESFAEVFKGYSGTYETAEQRLNAALYFDLKTFLHGLLLVEDKISMAHSLETRLPFLDNEVVDLALQLPAGYKLSGNASLRAGVAKAGPNPEPGAHLHTSDGKRILREAMTSLLPREVTEARKQGFSAPDASWFRHESYGYITKTLSPDTARIYQYLDTAFVVRALEEHRSGQANHRLLIWSLLSLEWWLQQFMD